MSAPTYRIDTLVQMSMIPADALPRFLAELPIILGEMQRIREAVASANEVAGAEVLGALRYEGVDWIDDDLCTIDRTISFSSFGGELPDIHSRSTFSPTGSGA